MSDLQFILAQTETDGFGRVLIGVLFVAIWIIVQVVAAAGARKKKQEAEQRALRRTDPRSGRPPQHPPAQAERPGVQRQQGQMSQEEIRRRLREQGQPVRQRVPEAPVRTQRPQPVRQPQPQPQHRPRPLPEPFRPAQQKPAPQRQPVAPPAPTADTTVSVFQEEIATTEQVVDSEIGSRVSAHEGAGQRRQRRARHRQLAALLHPRRLPEVILAAELLGPPVALREERKI